MPSLALRYTTNKQHSTAWTCMLRFTLLFTNAVLVLVGLVILAYAAVAWLEYQRAVAPHPSPAPLPAHQSATEGLGSLHLLGVLGKSSSQLADATPHPWFVEATAIMGAATTCTAALGLIAGLYPGAWSLNTYSGALLLMLIAQLSGMFFILIDNSWKKWPPDPSGELKKLRDWVERNYKLSIWLGMAVLTFQVFAVVVSCALHAAHQQLEEQVSSDDDEEDPGIWTPPDRRKTSPRYVQQLQQPILRPGSTYSGGRSPASVSAASTATGEGRGQRQDPWSRRMREKYGLDTSVFTYNPDAAEQGSDAGERETLNLRDHGVEDRAAGKQLGASRCCIM